MLMRVLDHLEEWFITFLMGAATLIIFAAVMHRYAAGMPIPVVQDWLLTLNFGWAQELCIIMFVWMAKFGAAYGVRTGIHVGVDVIINRLAPANRAKFIVFGLLSGALFTGIVATLGATFVWDNGAHYAIFKFLNLNLEGMYEGPTTPDLEWPTWIVYCAVPFGSGLMCFRFLQVCVAFIRTGELPHHDHGHVEGVEEETLLEPGKEDQIYRMDDDLHPHDVGSGCRDNGRGEVARDRTLIIFALLILLMLSGMPISISLGLTVLSFLFFMTHVPIESVALKLFTGIEKFEIMAIPFFILAGNFLTHGGVARRMINFASSMVGHMFGGLGLAGVLACALFAAVSGSSPATVVAIGSILMPAMVKAGFPKRFGAGVITTSGGLGILIPPSIVMVMYSVSTNTSVGALFIAGVIPGIVLATMLGATTWYRARSNNYPRQPKASWPVRFKAFRDSVWGLLLIVIVMGGIYTGIFTPTEAAAMSAVWAFIAAVFIYKDLRLKDVPRVLLASANMSAMLLYIITNAVLFSFLMTHENIPQAMADAMIGTGVGVIGFLLIANLLLLAAGNFMEPSSIVLILAPILFPIAMKLGIDPVHFGIMMVVNMEVGMCHPPVGLNLYVASGITKMGITELTIAVWPWLVTMLVFLVIVTYWPGLTAVPAEAARHHPLGHRSAPPRDAGDPRRHRLRVPPAVARRTRLFRCSPTGLGERGGTPGPASAKAAPCGAARAARPATKGPKMI